MQQRKAVALISGGLDSMLATKVIQNQGIHVEGINFYTGFCVQGHTHAIRKKDRQRPKRNNALWVAEQLGIKLHILDISAEYKDIVLNPKHGYGANLNPCLDCKGFMVGQALRWMQKHSFDFIITGEVMGQRPMSQRKHALPVVIKDSGVGDLLLRPLCAKHLPQTRPEIEDWVNRDRLYGFNGRSRKPQIALAAEFGFEEYSQPAGGCCFLTDAEYSKKLADLWQSRGRKDYEMDDILLLKVGRHIRPKEHFKLIVAREEGENNFLEGYRKQFTHLRTISHKGPLVLLDGEVSRVDLELACQITARFSQGRDAKQVDVQVKEINGAQYLFQVKPLSPQGVLPQWYI